MKYWGDDQIIQHDVKAGQQINICSTPGPAIKGKRLDSDVLTAEYFEIEIVPGTEHQGQYIDLITNETKNGKLVEVLIRNSNKEDTFNPDTKSILALSWFGLNNVPKSTKPKVISAYDAAMAVI